MRWWRRCWHWSPPPAPAAAAQWRVDPARSSIAVTFDVGGKPVEARFKKFKAEVTFDPKDLGASRVVITVDLASFRSGDAQRDQMVGAAEFLGTGAAGTARYATRGFTAKGGDNYEVAAELTLKGVTQPLNHQATIAIKGGEAHAQGEVKLDRLAFGVGAGQFPRGDQVGLDGPGALRPDGRAGGLSRRMALLNTATAWGWPAKTLHWIVAALVLGLLLLGFSMVWLVSGLGTKFELYQLHKSLGVLVCALVVVRLAWRWLNPRVPALPGDLEPWERVAARLTHHGLYALLLVMPVTGWILASSSPLGLPTVVFGLFILPNPSAPTPRSSRP